LIGALRIAQNSKPTKKLTKKGKKRETRGQQKGEANKRAPESPRVTSKKKKTPEVIRESNLQHAMGARRRKQDPDQILLNPSRNIKITPSGILWGKDKMNATAKGCQGRKKTGLRSSRGEKAKEGTQLTACSAKNRRKTVKCAQKRGKRGQEKHGRTKPAKRPGGRGEDAPHTKKKG